MGQIQPGPRGFINLQNKFGEEVRSFIQSAQDLIGQFKPHSKGSNQLNLFHLSLLSPTFFSPPPFSTAPPPSLVPASDMSLTAKPALHSKFRPDDFVQMKMAAENLRVLAER